MSKHETAPTSVDPADVGLQFLTVAHQVKDVVDQHMAKAGLSLSRTKVLQLLARRGALHQAELAEALGQAPRSVTQAVEALERLQLVTRTGDPEDRRRKTVSLTDQGRTALAAGEEAGRQILQQIFGTLDAHQLARMETLLGHTDTAARRSIAR
ncbi:MarR family winged helix-turn-helix transcriptional regulator [Streptomyces gibsoniae]|uniref:MarR family transcriptional regulator n=1 Tax=Streptomyces gibsoniae TaxID=3075529 RepID=A0ABU2U200_9ACTN|nr:MarR family transcriptional regulator [Streptomyces sp. DSM 41699]MDT0467252.1 MarR family transcriptional regulator [Streptomyces sp. DSM 41699]